MIYPEPNQVCSILKSTKFRWTTERELQDGIQVTLTQYGIGFSREHILSETDRIDFLLFGGIGIEVKTRGAIVPLLAQLGRYSEHACISSLVVVTARIQLSRLPSTIGGKAIQVVSLLGGIL